MLAFWRFVNNRKKETNQLRIGLLELRWDCQKKKKRKRELWRINRFMIKAVNCGAKNVSPFPPVFSPILDE